MSILETIKEIIPTKEEVTPSLEEGVEGETFVEPEDLVEETEAIEEEEVTSEDVVLGVTPCKMCGKPSTILSPNGNPFCCLACQTNFGN